VADRPGPLCGRRDLGRADGARGAFPFRLVQRCREVVSAETKRHDGAVLPRALAGAATAWSVVYLVVYLWVIDAQEGEIVWWYVVLIVLAALSFARAALGASARSALTVGLVISALAMLVGLLSLGALLTPTVVAAAIALVVTRPSANAPAATDQPRPSQQRGVSH
jgi:hypothetical protein